MTLLEIKTAIWNHRKIHRNPIDLQVWADKAKVRLPINNPVEAEKLLKLLNKGSKKTAVKVSDEAHRRYCAAKLAYETIKFPNWVKDGNHLVPERLSESTNDLTTFIVDFLQWSGHFANRTGNEGRVIKNKAGKQIRIASSSKNGMQDIDSNLKHSEHKFGIPWKIEVKAGKDTHKEHQKEFGKLVLNTGGHYSVVRNADDFLDQYDQLMIGNIVQNTIFA